MGYKRVQTIRNGSCAFDSARKCLFGPDDDKPQVPEEIRQQVCGHVGKPAFWGQWEGACLAGFTDAGVTGERACGNGRGGHERVRGLMP